MTNYHFSFVLLTLEIALITQVNSSTWKTFKISHVLDPESTEATSYYNWNPGEWVSWLNARDELDRIERGSKTNPNPLITKGINSVVISSPDDIKASFANALILFKSNSNGNLFWSANHFAIYTIKRTNRGDHEVFRCERFYFVAALNPNKEPVHFHACGTTVIANHVGNYQFPWKDCVKIAN